MCITRSGSTACPLIRSATLTSVTSQVASFLLCPSLLLTTHFENNNKLHPVTLVVSIRSNTSIISSNSLAPSKIKLLPLLFFRLNHEFRLFCRKPFTKQNSLSSRLNARRAHCVDHKQYDVSLRLLAVFPCPALLLVTQEKRS